MTRNLKLLAVFGLIWSVGFFSVLNWCLYNPEARGLIIAAAAVTYGLGYAVAGFLLGRKDSSRATRRNLGLWYYATANLTSLLVGGLWIVIYRRDRLIDLGVMTLIFGIFLGIAILSSRKTIKGVEKEKLFQ